MPTLPSNRTSRTTNSDLRSPRLSHYSVDGTITLLAQEEISGLRAQRIDGEWISIPPIAGGIAVNIGEMLMRWSNDVLRATPHQVLDDVGSDSATVPERHSIAFFCNANKDTVLDCLPGCCGDEQPAKYEPVNAHEYITGRLAGTISPAA
jgi:isopenicillin N synthase-like dioxygenase